MKRKALVSIVLAALLGVALWSAEPVDECTSLVVTPRHVPAALPKPAPPADVR